MSRFVDLNVLVSAEEQLNGQKEVIVLYCV